MTQEENRAKIFNALNTIQQASAETTGITGNLALENSDRVQAYYGSYSYQMMSDPTSVQVVTYNPHNQRDNWSPDANPPG
ncbi:MAG: hypothetical protein NWE89_10625 [Candidatus Bathyarchaeota archaeon]|nr:hypothetical protein [Candidatus Bathyarchaeota archaeon]